jgi:sugar phosphate isomerase/epimerase
MIKLIKESIMILLGGPVFIETQDGKKIPSHELNYKEYDPELAVQLHKELGYKAAYAPFIPTSEIMLIQKAAQAFKKNKIKLAEVGYWENLQSRDAAERKAHVERMCETLACADEMGAACAVNTIGSYSYGGICDDINEKNFSQEFFETAVDNARYIINQVKPKYAKLTYENFALTALDSLDTIEKMVNAVDSPSFGVHMDATNLVTCPRELFKFNDIVRDAFQRFGGKIASCHIKDLRLVYPVSHVEIRETIPGDGMLDVSCYLREIHKLSRGVPCMAEHLSSEREYTRARENIIAIAEKNGFGI